MWSLILKVTFGKGTLPCAKPYILILLCMGYIYNALSLVVMGICNCILKFSLIFHTSKSLLNESHDSVLKLILVDDHTK